MSMCWQEWEQDLLRREPKPKCSPLVDPHSDRKSECQGATVVKGRNLSAELARGCNPGPRTRADQLMAFSVWDWFFVAYAVCAVIALLVVWIGDYSV